MKNLSKYLFATSMLILPFVNLNVSANKTDFSERYELYETNLKNEDDRNLYFASLKGNELKYFEDFKEFVKKEPLSLYKQIFDEKLVQEKTDSLFDFNMMYALAFKESNLNRYAINYSTGARGYFQLMKNTWEGSSNESFDNAYIPKKNFEIAVENFSFFTNYLKDKNPNWNSLSKEEKQMQLLAAHNWGQKGLRKNHFDVSKAPYQTRDLIKKVIFTKKYLEGLK